VEKLPHEETFLLNPEGGGSFLLYAQLDLLQPPILPNGPLDSRRLLTILGMIALLSSIAWETAYNKFALDSKNVKGKFFNLKNLLHQFFFF
jgi:hypothetical protein